MKQNLLGTHGLARQMSNDQFVTYMKRRDVCDPRKFYMLTLENGMYLRKTRFQRKAY